MRTTVVVLSILLVGLAGCGKREEAFEPKTFQGRVVTTYDDALASARSEKKPILVVAGDAATLSGLENNLLSMPAIADRSGEFITAKLDSGSQSAALKQLGATQNPTMLVLRPDGSVVWRGAGAVNPGPILAALDQAKGATP